MNKKSRRRSISGANDLIENMSPGVEVEEGTKSPYISNQKKVD
ncbi:hypothetical protein A2U01_0064897, partial [Trifolium medium]|nr:hypothetical protein [Trifolium medium]